MTRIVGIAGSLRRQSFNRGLLQAAAGLMPPGSTLDIHTLHGVPLYDADLEARDGVPEAVRTLKWAVASADGLILATPEYNNGVPGVFKNAIDWMSRPSADIGRVFGGRPTALIGASPGGFGTILAQDAWLATLRTLGVRPWFEGRLMVSRATGLYDAEGQLIDDKNRQNLATFLAGFVAFAEAEART